MPNTQTIQIKRSNTTTTPPTLVFGEIAFTDISGQKKFFIGDANGNVYQIKISDLDAAGADVALGGNKLVNVGDGILDSDGATWGQVKQLVKGLSSKEAVRVAEGANINLSNPGTAVFNGITLAQGDRLLLYGQTNQGQNGIYVFDTSTTPLVRSEDANTLSAIDASTVVIDQGTTGILANTILILQVDNVDGVLGTEPIAVVPFLGSNLPDSLNSIALLSPSSGDLIYWNGTGYSNYSLSNNAILAKDGTGNFVSLTGADGSILARVNGAWQAVDTIDGGTY